MTAILWGRLSSCNVQKAMWTLEEVDLPYQRIDLGGDFGGLDDPAYRALNPHGKVPTLRDGDVIVWESNAIVRYLAATYAPGTLWPEQPAARVEADKWMAWTDSLYRSWIELFWKFVRTPPDRHDTQRIHDLHEQCIARYAALNDLLAMQTHLAGDRFTMADIPAGMTLYRWFEMDLDRPSMPHLEAWYEKLRQRPAYVKAVCVPFEDLVGKVNF
jgi:glutathione S-transferase